MTTHEFSISSLAVAEITRQLSRSDIRNPFVTLGESSDDLAVSEGFLEAIAGGKSPGELKALATDEYQRLQPTLKLYLAVLIYDFDKHRPNDLRDIAGIPFSLPQQTLDFLREYQLDYSAGRFVLRKGEHVFQDLRSLPGLDAAT